MLRPVIGPAPMGPVLSLPGILLSSVLVFFNADGFAQNKGFGHLFMRTFQDGTQRLTRDTHLFGGLFLIHSFQISQSDGFEFIGGQFDAFEFTHRDAARLEIGRGSPATDLSFYLRSWHGLFLAYATNCVDCFLYSFIIRFQWLELFGSLPAL